MNNRSQFKRTEVLHSFNELPKMSNSSQKQRHFEQNDEQNAGYYICPNLQVGLEEDPVAVVIDGTNLYKLSRAIHGTMPPGRGFSIDYKILSSILEANFPNIKRKFFVISQTIMKSADDSSGYSAIRTLLDWLDYHQYTVITRDIHVDNSQNDENDSRKMIHPSMDIEITTALFKAAKIANRIVFFGSERKWEIPLKILRDEWDKNITVVSAVMPNGNRRLVADELRKIDHFVDLNTEWFHERFKRSENSRNHSE